MGGGFLDQQHCHPRTNTALAVDARAALRMIREVVEQLARPGSVPSEEMVEPPFVKEAEVLVQKCCQLHWRDIGRSCAID